MKNLFRFLSLILVLMLVETSFVSCADIAQALGSKNKTTPAAKVETDSAGNKVEKVEQGIKYCEFKSNDPDWKLYWEDSKLKLSNNEKVFEYGDYRAEEWDKFYTHGLQFYPANETESAELIVSDDKSEAIILYDSIRFSCDQPNQKCATLVELENGTILRNVYPVASQIFHANGYEDSELEPYYAQNNGKEEPSYKLTLTAEFKDGKPYFRGGVVTDDKKFDITAVVGEAFNIGEDFKSLECDHFSKTIMTAFIEKDTEALETFYGYEKGMLDPYKTLEFGNYKAVVVEDGKVLLTVEVTESSIDTIPVGEHIFEITGGMYGCSMIDLGRDHSNTPETKAEKFVASWINSPWFGYMLKTANDIPSEELFDFSTNVYDFLYGYLGGYEEDSTLTEEDYLAAAKAIFGLEYDAGFYNVFSEDENGNLTYMFGHGGFSYFYDFVESDDTHAVVQFYADCNYTIKSHLVRYDFQDGEYLKIVSSEIIEEAEYEPDCFSV